MSRKLICSFLILCAIQCIRSEGYYTIVGPKTFRANSEYHVALSSHGGISTPVEIRVGIKGNLSEASGSGYDNYKVVSVPPLTTQVVPIQIATILPGTYKLYAQGLNGIVFNNETSLEYNVKEFNIFVQTDKSIYKPGDTVRFRVIFLDANLKGVDTNQEINIFITDANRNRVKQWKKVKTTKGVYSADLPLSSDPNLGTWNIEIEVGETKESKSFEVDEYVLPKFEVIVDAQKHAAYKDGKITAVIRSKYTYGKFVKGEVTVSAYPTVYVGSLQPFERNIISRKVMPIDGKAVIEFSIVDDLGLRDTRSERDIIVEAIVEEALTGRKQNGTGKVTLHKSKYTIEIKGDTEKFKPGLPYAAWVIVKHHDGSPVQDTVNKVTVEYEKPHSWRHPMPILQPTYDVSPDGIVLVSTTTTTTPAPIPPKQELTLDANGMARIKIDNVEDMEHFLIKAKYLDVSYDYFNVHKDTNKVGVYLQAKALTETPQINNEVSVEVRATENMKWFTYQVIGRGDVLDSNTVEVPDQKVFKFRFLATFAMVPKAQIIVYFITAAGDIVSDKIEVKFPSVFQNPVKIDLSRTRSKPGQDIDITVSTKPNSFVGLLGVDQSVLLLKSGNDFDRERIFDALKQYEEQSHIRPWLYRGKRQYGYGQLYPMFTEVGTVVLTNAKAQVPEYQGGYGGGIFGLQGAPGPSAFGPAVGIASASFDGALESESRPNSPFEIPVTVRKEFPETWIWEDIVEG